ncbi:hypothetical protein FYJ51_09225 [Erysipelotrichaceae bacterium Oil+RF-744-GAM-WT-6]|uniref:PTS EIIA type-4 domain-containing protein n=2 Tax=Stecheria intestinalis TaxID=2606630 RepID=A0A7X2NT69_9FIRM|nr:hypothetical protein [Stecheria intestinalis]
MHDKEKLTQLMGLNIFQLVIARKHMTRILLLSHGRLCEEMYSTMKLIVGDVPEFSCILQPADGDMRKYEADIRDALKNPEPLLVVTDLFGGSPLITLAKVYGEQPGIYEKRVRIVTGMNLPMLLELSTLVKSLPVEQLAAQAVESGHAGIIDFQKKLEESEK